MWWRFQAPNERGGIGLCRCGERQLPTQQEGPCVERCLVAASPDAAPRPPQATLKLLGQVNTQKLADGGAHKFGLNLVIKV
jgi:hypothetical protein